MNSSLPIGFAAAALFASTTLCAQTREVTFAYQDMLVPLRTIIESGELEKSTGYKINRRQFGGGGDVIRAMASGDVQIGEAGSSPILLQNATVFDEVAFPLRIHGKSSPGDMYRRVRECLDLVGLLDKVDSHPAQLSGGQKQRVAIARALAPRPDVLLCDEPTSALDSETTRSVLDTLRDVNRRLGVTVLIVTHELAVVRALCRTVAVMEGGEVAEQFTVDDAGPNRGRRVTALGRADAQNDLERLEAALA